MDDAELSRRWVDFADEEQRLMALAVTESIGQELVGIGLLAYSLYRRLQDQSPLNAHEMASLLASIEEAKQRLHMVEGGLVGRSVKAESLARELAALALESARLYRIDCRLERTDGAHPPNDSAATQLFRIAQDAIRSAVHRRRARRVRVRLATAEDQVTLEIRDDGIASANVMHAFPETGLGVMRHRARLMGATLDVDHGDGEVGQVLTCSVSMNGRTENLQ